MITYSRTQRSPLLPVLAIIVVAGVAFAAVVSDGGLPAVGVLMIAGGLLAFVTLVFARLTVDVGPDHLRVAFGAGWPAKTIDFVDVVTAKAVRNRWWYGWGIRWIPRGRLWNVWGLDAVEFELGNGRRFRVGTDEPEVLLAALSGRVSLG